MQLTVCWRSDSYFIFVPSSGSYFHFVWK